VRLELVVAATRYDAAITDRDGVALRMAKDATAVQNEVSLFRSHPTVP